MSNSIVVNSNARSIVLTKKFAAAAKHYGTPEYYSLQEVRRDYPDFRIEVRVAAKKARSFKGLTFDYMESYLKLHNADLLSDFNVLRGKTPNGEGKALAEVAAYGEIKKWFLSQFPEVSLQRKTIEDILGKTPTAKAEN